MSLALGFGRKDPGLTDIAMLFDWGAQLCDGHRERS
jgi:hypothetical protein